MFEFVVVADLGAFCFVWLLQCRFWVLVGVLGGLPVVVFVVPGFLSAWDLVALLALVRTFACRVVAAVGLV